jgi:hypothetical protein
MTLDVSAQEVANFRAQNPKEADQICGYWPIIKPFLELVRSLPFVPAEVKSAIDWIVTFGDRLCPKFQATLLQNKLQQFSAMTAVAEKPDWQKGIDWAIGDTGPVDCPAQYAATYPECIFKGGRSCLMSKAIDAAKANNCSWAFQLTLITQCHNSAAQTALAIAGQQAICDYLKIK